MNLADLTVGEITEKLKIKPYKAKQIYKWIRRGVTDYSEMTDLSLDLRRELSENFEIYWPKVFKKFVSKLDGTVKYLIELNDGNIIETVLMKYEHGNSICISSQVGCRMGCAFCASTEGGLVRNLTPSEIEGQIRIVSLDSGKRVSNVVIMGIGEPMDNYDNVINALSAINNPDGLNIGYRHITISTCGLESGIKKLTSEGIPVTLALSLHAPNDEIRKTILPAAKATSVSKLIDLCRDYVDKTGRRVTFEYALIGGVNDSPQCATELAKLLSGLLCHVNLIEVNPVEGKKFTRGKNKTEFINILTRNKVNVTVRRELGKDISASCGQLRKSAVKGE